MIDSWARFMIESVDVWEETWYGSSTAPIITAQTLTPNDLTTARWQRSYQR